MSTTIDQRVVEMRFDNKHFEQNVSTTMSTLDKLKQKLHLDGATKGLENISSSAKKVDLSNVGRSAESIGAKFTAMEVVAVTALANITNSAVNAGKRIVAALTIQPVTTGFKEYELKMGSVQTIMASTGESLDTVNQYLQELNEYSDKTIYSFSDMTTNIGKFTNAGVKLEDAVAAIKGISNEAALSGANANEASRAMYNFAQALSAGYVKLIDWKSIENANMATVQFKEQLIESAVAAGTLTEEADGMYKTVDGKLINATKNFNDSLQDQWMTTEVLVNTLRKYSDETTEIGKKATAAAQDVKTWTMLFDTLKEAAQSGWAQTWELIFGDFEEVKEFLTGLSGTIGSFIDGMSDYRNSILGNTLDSNWDKLVDAIGNADISMDDFNKKVKDLYENDEEIEKLVEEFGSLEKAIKADKIPTDLLKKAIRELGISGSKAGDKIANFVDGLKEIERMLGRGSVGDDVKKLQEALEELGYSVGEHGIDGIIGPDTQKAIMEFQKAAGIAVDGVAGPETLKALEKAGSSMKEIAEETSEAAIEYDNLIDNITQKGGRELLLEGLSNTFKSLIGIFKSMGAAWGEIFPAEGIYNGLFKAIETFNKFSKTLLFTEEALDENGNAIVKFNDKGEKLIRIFKGAFAALDTVLTIIGGPLRIAFDIITGLLDKFGINILDLFARMGDGFVKVNDAVSGFVGLFTDVVIDGIAKWIESFKETEFFKTCAEWIEDASKTITDAISDLSERFDEFSTSAVVEKLSAFGGVISGIASKVKNSEMFISIIDGICGAFGRLKEFFTGFKLPEFNLDNLSWSAKRLRAFDGATGIGSFFSGLGTELKNNVIKWDWNEFKVKALTSFAEWWLKVGEKVKKAFEALKEVFAGIKEFIFGTEDVQLMDILKVVEKFLILKLLISAINAFDTLASPIEDLTKGLNNIAKSIKWRAIGDAFKAMAIALGVLTVCMIVIAKIPAEDAYRSAGILAGLIIVLGGIIMGMAAIVSKIDGGFDVMKLVLSLLMLSGSIAILVYALKELDNMNLKNYWKTFGTLGLVLVGISLGLKMVSKSCNGSLGSVVAILTMLAGIKMMLDIIDAYDEYTWTGKLDAILRMIQMLAVIAVALNIASRGLKSGANMHGMAMTVLAMVISLKLMVGIVKDFAELSEAEFQRGRDAIMWLMGMMTAMIAVANLTSQGTVLEKGQKNVNNFTGLAVALLAVVAAVWLLGKMATNDYDSFMAGIQSVGLILAGFTTMLYLIGKSCSGLKMGSVVTILIGIAAIMVVLAIVLHSMKDFSWEQSLASAGALGGLLIAIVASIKILSKNNADVKNIGKWLLAILALEALVLGLSIILRQMNDLDPVKSIANAGALSILLATIAGVLFVCSKLVVTKNIWAAIGAIAAIAVLGAIVLELGYFLSLISKWNIGSMIPEVKVLSILLGVLTIVMGACAALGIVAGIAGVGMVASVAAIAALGAIVLELGFFLSIIKKYDIGSMMPEVKVLSALLGVLTIVMGACAVFGIVAGIAGVGIIASVAAIAALGAIVLELGFFLSIIKKYDIGGMMPEIKVLSNLLAVLTIVMGACAVLGLVAGISGVGMFAAIAGIAALGLVVLELGYFLSIIKGYDIGGMMSEVKVLSHMLIALTVVAAACSLVGFVAVPALAGIGVVLLFVSALTGLIIALGKICSSPEIASFLDTGIATLEKLAYGLGSVISKFGEGLTSKLPEIGTNLSTFAINLSTFILTMRMIDQDLASKSACLADAIMTLVKADLLDALNKGSFSDLGNELSTFGSNAAGFITAMENMKPETAVAMESFFAAIKSLNDVMGDNNLTDGSLGTFGESISSFATCITDAADTLSGITDEDVANIQRSADAGTALAELNRVIPRQGGDWQDFIGEKDLATFGESIVAFAACLVRYSEAVSGQSIDKDAIIASADAGTSLAELNKAIPRQGGDWQDFAGEKDLATFGDSIVAFASCLVRYSSVVSGSDFDSEAVKNSALAAQELAAIYDYIPKTGGVWQNIAGEKDIESFGNSLVAFGAGIASYCETVKAFEDISDETTAIQNSVTIVEELQKVVNSIDSTSWFGKIFGEKDGQGFGDALASMAKGITDYIAAIETMGDVETVKTKIQNSKSVVTELGTVLEAVPTTDYSQSSENLYQAVADIKAVAVIMNSITTSEYDFSGLDGLKTAIGTLTGMVPEGKAATVMSDFGKLVSAVTAADTCANTMFMFKTYSYEGIDKFKQALTNLSSADIDGVIDAFSGKAPTMASAVSDLISAMTTTMSDGKEGVSNAMKSVMDAAHAAVKDRYGDFKTAGQTMATNVKTGITSSYDTIRWAGEYLANVVRRGAESKYGDMMSAGAFIVSGFAIGIRNNTHLAVNATITMADLVKKAAKDAFNINSPSKEFRDLGYGIPEGLALGIDKMTRLASASSENMAHTVIDKTSGIISRISDAINSDIDTQPTIRPVLDLSDVQSGANSINSLFGSGASVGLLANVGSISSSMNRRGQNGANGDVVSAIDKLSRKMDNINNTSYTINGITYDDGSSVANAIETIVRAAVRERRI